MCPGVFFVDLIAFLGSCRSFLHSTKFQQWERKHTVYVAFFLIHRQNLQSYSIALDGESFQLLVNSMRTLKYLLNKTQKGIRLTHVETQNLCSLQRHQIFWESFKQLHNTILKSKLNITSASLREYTKLRN